MGRRGFDPQAYVREGVIRYKGPTLPPEAQERGWKDTVIAYAGQVTQIIMRFGPYAGMYVWHCHILEHEDYEMMRPLKVIP